MKPISITVLGATGRMGAAVIRSICSDDRFDLVGAVVRAGSVDEGRDAGRAAGLGDVGVAVSSVLPACDVVIDFSTPLALSHYLPSIEQHGAALVTGTTGLTSAQQDQVEVLSRSNAVLADANMSIGVQLVYRLVAAAAGALDAGTDIDLFEAHHRHKKDAPSGTALVLGRRVADARGQDFDQVARLSRQGEDCPRQAGEIGFSALRAGDIVGEHTVLFGLPGERIEITHRAASREAFVRGALEAAYWLASRAPGQYQLADIFELTL